MRVSVTISYKISHHHNDDTGSHHLSLLWVSLHILINNNIIPITGISITISITRTDSNSNTELVLNLIGY